VVLERSFADELGVGAGGQVTLNGRSFRVAGVAVTAAWDLSTPQVCFSSCDLTSSELAMAPPGLVWMTRADAVSLATAAQLPLSYTLNLKLADPADADAFANGYDNANASSAAGLQSWESIAWDIGSLIRSEQFLLLIGSWLLGLLAVASVAVLVGGRMAEQTRRVGLLKAVGSTPGLVAAVLLAEHLVLAVVAAAMGLLVGWLVAPLLTSPGAALLGSAGAPPLTLVTIAIVVGVALAVAAVATLVPAIRAARTSTVGALARALGATPQQVSAGLSAAQVLPALVGALLGIPGGIGLVSAVNKDGKTLTLPPLWWLVATVLVTTVAVAAITIVPAWLGTLRPPGEVLQSETA
jgi:ABC-type lipoprotein release transport system permease subunit